MKLRAGLVGFGMAGRSLHAPLIMDADIDIAAVVSSQTNAVDKHLPTAQTFADIDSMLGQVPLDLIVIATPNQLHVSQAMEALRAGKHVVIDKPMALHSDDAAELIATARDTQRLLVPFHNRRWDSDFLTVRRLLAERALGDVLAYEARWDRYRPDVIDRWREHASEGGGVLNDLGPHLIDQALCLFGEPDWLEAELLKQRIGAKVDDAFEIRMGKGRVNITLSASCLVNEPTPRFVVSGTAGTFRKYGLDVQEAQLRSGMKPDATAFGVEPSQQWGQLVDARSGIATPVAAERGDWRQFYKRIDLSIQTGQSLPVEAADALAVIKLIEAARLSSAQGYRINFQDQRSG